MNSESHTETCCNQTFETPESSEKEGSCRTQRIINMLSADFPSEILEARRPDIVKALKEGKKPVSGESCMQQNSPLYLQEVLRGSCSWNERTLDSDLEPCGETEDLNCGKHMGNYKSQYYGLQWLVTVLFLFYDLRNQDLKKKIISIKASITVNYFVTPNLFST